ncbi:hypothetical protein TraAM80_10205, partial [Trypanosoma rangeli]
MQHSPTPSIRYDPICRFGGDNNSDAFSSWPGEEFIGHRMAPSKLRKSAIRDGFSVLLPAAWAPATPPKLRVHVPPLLLSIGSLSQRNTHINRSQLWPAGGLCRKRLAVAWAATRSLWSGRLRTCTSLLPGWALRLLASAVVGCSPHEYGAAGGALQLNSLAVQPSPGAIVRVARRRLSLLVCRPSRTEGCRSRHKKPPRGPRAPTTPRRKPFNPATRQTPRGGPIQNQINGIIPLHDE